MTRTEKQPTEDWPVARFSSDRRYRYTLTRRVGFGDRVVTFLMLNPSTADEVRNDPTVTRCFRFAARWGFGWLLVVNLSPLRATDPADLASAGAEPEDIWQTNLNSILEAAAASELLVAAYGVHGRQESRAERVLDALTEGGHEIQCLGLTKDGHPRHPLYVRADSAPREYFIRGQTFEHTSNRQRHDQLHRSFRPRSRVHG